MYGGRSNQQLWRKLVHNGVYFPPVFERLPKSVHLRSGKTPVVLNEAQEEAACLYARAAITNPNLDKTFVRNFHRDFRALFPKGSAPDPTTLDFSPIITYLKTKPKGSATSAAQLDKYRKCEVDGVEQPVANFMVEPPSLFKGRGDHPLRGKIKRRIFPEDVIINISKEAPVPKPNVPGKWGQVIEDKHAMWIACWRQPVTGKLHYVWLGQESEIQMKKDKEKFETARALYRKIGKIRARIDQYIRNSTSAKEQQLGTAVWIIDNLAIRVGNEKGDDEAQTVGVTGLLKEHVTLDGSRMRLNFLGKDSVRYCRSVDVPPDVLKNMESFLKNKSADDQVFHLIDSKAVNEFLQSLMPGLTAKVFRTMNSSLTFQILLRKAEERLQGKYDPKDVYREFTMANVAVAELCNHQKMVATHSHKDQMKKLDERIARAKTPKQKKELKDTKRLKQAVKNLNLGTSRQNYIDPRITIAFAKRMKVPMSKFLSKKLLSKFSWAMETEEDFVW